MTRPVRPREGPPHQAQLGAAFGGRPYVQETIGQIAALVFAAEATTLRAAEAIDAAWADRLSNASLTEASIAVAQAQYFAVDAALKSSEFAFDVGGASSCDREYNRTGTGAMPAPWPTTIRASGRRRWSAPGC